MTDTDEEYLTDLWYLASPGAALKSGDMVGKIFMDRPVLLGRDAAGAPFAFEDLCPHRGVRLSEGRFDGETVACPFHGWRFGADGGCKAIPSLVADQQVDLAKINVRTYPTAERQGNIWIYLSKDPVAPGADVGAPFEIPEIGDVAPRIATPLLFETDIDNAVYGLLDPAHTPYVHESALWRRPDQLKEKQKDYAPSDLGFTMVRHAPASNSTIYKLLGGKPTTEISFRLPGLRLEHIRIGKHHICNMTAMTPVSARKTEVTNFLYWTNPVLNLAKPFMTGYARRFLGQDQWIIGLQNEASVFDPQMMLVNDADVPQRWYERLKREWRRVQAEGGAFENPVEAATLKWRT